MEIQALDRIFKPQRIALVGVTPNPKSVGGRVLANLVGGGFRGVVYPVNPTSEAVMGIPCFRDVKSLPKTPDLAILCGPAAQVPDIVRECGEAGVPGLVILSAGFKETGPEGRALEDRVLAEVRRFDGMRVIGPNCLGFISPGLPLNASFAAATPRAGNVAFISQSGALCTAVLDWALEEKIGFSHFVSVGNAMDVDFGDLIDYLGEDEATRSIILYIESIRDARRFMTAARAKPIVAYKAGRFPESAAVAASHTGALASEDAVYDAAFQRMGLARVYEIGEIFDCAELVGRHRVPAGPRLAVLTNAGGPGVMASDALIAARGTLARLSEETLGRLNEELPPQWSRRNPVDVLGDAKSKLIAKAAQTVLRDPGVDALLVIVTPQAMTNPTAIARETAALAATTEKPVLAAWLGGASMHEGVRLLIDAGVPTYSTPERAVKAFMTLVSYARNLEILYETPKDVTVDLPAGRTEVRDRFTRLFGSAGTTLSEGHPKDLLAAYGIPVVRPEPAATADKAAAVAERIGYPVVLKVLSPDIIHKSDVGGVALDLGDAGMVRAAFEGMRRAVRERAPQARFDGASVQKMVEARDGTEATLRPIKPEDEPLWMALLASCSRESIYSRFRYFFFWQSHEVASRYCYIDYDREMAIVAETGEGDDRKLVGVGRLAAEPGRPAAEYAVVVLDAWQNRGLGGLLTDDCMEIARQWGLRKLTAITTTDNPRMIAVFEKRGFRVVRDLESSLVEVTREI